MSPADSTASSGELPRRRARQIFDKQIVPALLAPYLQPQSSPRLTLFGAQPGAGKTTLARILTDRAGPDRRPITLDFDALRAFYPGYHEIKRRRGLTGDRLVTNDVYRWLRMAFDYVRSHRTDLIIEHTLGSAQQVRDVLDRFTDPHHSQSPAYSVDLAVLAVPAADSRLGMLERYQLALEIAGHGRYPGDALHDRRYISVVETTDELQTDPRISAITVYRRGGETIGHNTRGRDGGWVSDMSVRQMITVERQLAWDLRRSREWLDIHHDLSERMAPAWQKSLRRAWHDAQPILDPAALAISMPVDDHTRDWDLLTDRPSPITAPPTDNTPPSPGDLEVGVDPATPDLGIL